MLTQQRIKDVFNYFPESGLFTFKDRPWQPAGTLKKGYIYITVDDKGYFAHRLAWLYIHGEWPKQQIDHINGEKWDNRIENLRDVSPSVNMQNQPILPRKNNKSGFVGVQFTKRKDTPKGKPWAAKIRYSGKQHRLGYFRTKEEAHQAYLNAKRQFHPESQML